MTDPPMWSFDVFTSPHDDVKRGRLEKVRSRVNVSREEYPLVDHGVRRGG